MNELTPRMAEQVQDTRQIFPASQNHNATISSDEDYRFQIELRGTIVVDFLLQVSERKDLSIGNAAFRILFNLLANADGDALRQQRIECKISQGCICKKSGKSPTEGAIGNLRRPLKQLMRTGILRIAERGYGKNVTRYELIIPPEPLHLMPNSITFDGAETRTGAQANSSLPRTGARIDPHQKRVFVGDTREVFDDDPTISSSSTYACDPREADVAVDELKKAGIGEKKIGELLRVQSPSFLIAAILAARTNHMRNPAGFVITAAKGDGTVDFPSEFFRQAEELIEATLNPPEVPAPQPKSPAAPSSIPDLNSVVDELARITECIESLTPHELAGVVERILPSFGRDHRDSWAKQGISPIEIPIIRKAVYAEITSRREASNAG